MSVSGKSHFFNFQSHFLHLQQQTALKTLRKKEKLFMVRYLTFCFSTLLPIHCLNYIDLKEVLISLSYLSLKPSAYDLLFKDKG